MRKSKRKYIVAFILSIILALSALSVYAAFYMEHKKKTEIGFFDLSDKDVSFSYQLDLNSLSSPGAFKELSLSAQMPASSENGFYEYYYIIKVEGQNDLLEDSIEAYNISKSIFVYLDDKFLGTIYSLTENSLEGEFAVKKDLLITYGETQTNKLRFELHIPNSTGYFDNKNLKLSIKCGLSTVDVQSFTFVYDFFELKQALIQENTQGRNKVVVLADNITLTENIEVTSKKTLDLRGKKLNFNGNTINFNHEGTSTIKNSVGTPTFQPNGGGFILFDGVLDIKDSAVGAGAITSVVSCDTDAVIQLLINRFKDKVGFGLNSGETKEKIFGELDFYFDDIVTLGTSDTSYTYLNNNITAESTTISKNAVIVIGGEQVSFKIYGTTDLEDLNGVMSYLSYLTYLEDVDISYSIYLPTSLSQFNAKIEWKSSDPQIITNTGIVLSGGTARLTAIIKINNTVVTHTFTIHIESQTNEQRYQAILSAIGTIELSSVGFENAYTIPDDGLLEMYDLVSIKYTLDPLYDYISLQDKKVWLNKVTFKRFAQIGVEIEFAVGSEEPTDANRKIFNGNIRVNISLGTSNTELQQMVLAYIESEITKVNVLQNILDTRLSLGVENEKGDFVLPTEYEGFEIEYAISSLIASVDGGTIIIDPEKFLSSESLVAITVKIRIPNPDGDTPFYPAEKTMYFAVPGAIHNDSEGFADTNVFRSVRHQVLQQVGAITIASGENYTLDTKNYILLHDIAVCETLILENGAKTPKTSYTISDLTKATDSQIYHFQIGNLNSSVNGIKHFINLKRLSVLSTGTQMFDTSAKSLEFIKNVSVMQGLQRLEMQYCRVNTLSDISALKNLTYIDFIGNADISDLTPLIYLNHDIITYLDLSGTASATQSNANFNYELPILRNIYYRSYYAHSNIAPYIYYTNTSGVRTRYTITVNLDEANAYMYLFRLSEIKDAYEDSFIPLTNGVYTNNGTKIPVSWGVASTNEYLIYNQAKSRYEFKQNDNLVKYQLYEIIAQKNILSYVQRYYIIVDGEEVVLSSGGGLFTHAPYPNPRYLLQNGIFVPPTSDNRNNTYYTFLESTTGGYMKVGNNFVPIIADTQIPVVATASITIGSYTATRYFRFNITATG